VNKVKLELLVPRVNKVTQVLRVNKAILELQVPRVNKVKQVLRVLLGFKVILVLKERMERQAHLV
jgi:hypothetical protein